MGEQLRTTPAFDSIDVIGGTMERYKNLGGESGVVAYECAPGEITVKFSNGWIYLYNTQSTSSMNITEMQRLAAYGRGLNSFIARVVRTGFFRKWR
jgi:hypothetical protein